MKLLSTSSLIGRPAPEVRSGRLRVFLAIMLLVAATFGALYVEVAQAQVVDGAITGLTLTSDAPGTLTVSWDTASPTPTDYRVDWAKSDEGYTSWKVNRGHKYPLANATTVTITDLSHDTEYKVRMRARYYKGEYEGKSWGGPWAKASREVVGTPEEEPAAPAPPKLVPTTEPVRRDSPPQQQTTLPAAPNLTGTLLTPEGEVMLVWQNPSDDTITGYQVLRGPAADNLVVIEGDTGSSGTSYTDTSPPTGQTHTYAVKARNATGLSPLSNTLTATVPEPEEEPTVASHTSTDETLVSNLGQTVDTPSGALVGLFAGDEYEIAMPFTTGLNALGYHPTSLQLYLNKVGTDSPTPQVSIRGDSAGVPGETALYDLNTSTAITDTFRLFTFTTSDEVTLQPNTKYWLHVAALGGAALVQQTASDDEDVESQVGWSIGDAKVGRIGGGAWAQSSSSKIPRMKILGHDGIAPTIVDLPDDITTMGRLAVNGSVTDRLAPYDVDWFAFTAEANTNYQFVANPGEKGLPHYALKIFNDEGTELRSSRIAKKNGYYQGPDRVNILPFQTDMAGTYYVSIESLNGNYSTVAYTLAMFGDDYSDDITTTATVTVDGSGRNFEDFQNYVMRTNANHDSSRTDDVDWIRVALKANVTYEIVYDVACLHQGRIEGIYDSTGTLLRGTTLEWPRKTKGWCTDLNTEFTPSADGDHYIAVSAQGSHFQRGSVNPFTGVQGTLTITAK